MAFASWSGFVVLSSVGVDEVQWKNGHKYQTLVYQIDQDCKRLLWIGPDRTAKTLLRFWTSTYPVWAGKFLDDWCVRAMRRKLEPQKALAKTLRTNASFY